MPSKIAALAALAYAAASMNRKETKEDIDPAEEKKKREKDAFDLRFNSKEDRMVLTREQIRKMREKDE